MLPVERAILRGLVAACEETEDCWGVDTAVSEYLAQTDPQDSPIAYLTLVARDVWWHYHHVGTPDLTPEEIADGCVYEGTVEGRTDRESARNAERMARRALYWLTVSSREDTAPDATKIFFTLRGTFPS